MSEKKEPEPVRGIPKDHCAIDDAQDFLPDTVTIQRTTVTVKVNPEAKPKPEEKP